MPCNKQLRNHTRCLLNLLLWEPASEFCLSSESNTVKVKLFSSLFLPGNCDPFAAVMRACCCAPLNFLVIKVRSMCQYVRRETEDKTDVGAY